jgi:hypothetical protein
MTITEALHGGARGKDLIDIIIKIGGFAIMVGSIIAGISVAYARLDSKVDAKNERMEQAITQLATAIDALRADLKETKGETIKPADLVSFCLSASYQNKGWRCPLVDLPPVRVVKTIPVKQKASP